MLKTKCVYSRKSPFDGIRILATRFRGRGMQKSRYDVWMPSLGPSESLKQRSNKMTDSEFSREYKKELFLDGPIDRKCRSSKNHGQKYTLRLLKQLAKKTTVTLMCHCEDDSGCHRSMLKKLILKV